MDGLCKQRLETFLWNSFASELWDVSSTWVCGCPPLLCVFDAFACGGSNSVFQEAMECHSRGGQRSIRSNPSSCHCLPLLMASTCQLSGWAPSDRESHRQGNRSQRGCRMTSPPSKTPTVKQPHTSSSKQSASAGAGLEWLLQLQAMKPEINQTIRTFVRMLKESLWWEEYRLWKIYNDLVGGLSENKTKQKLASQSHTLIIFSKNLQIKVIYFNHKFRIFG